MGACVAVCVCVRVRLYRGVNLPTMDADEDSNEVNDVGFTIIADKTDC